MNVMTKKPTRGRPPAEEGPSVQVTLKLHPAIFAQLQTLADRNANSVPEEVRVACRERLEAKGLWPPPGEAN